MADKRISELDSVQRLNNDAVFPMSQDNGGEETTYKATLTTLAAKIAEDMTFSNLTTNAKKLVLAINELKASGTTVMLGTTAPTAQQGNDGNVYVQYTAGTGGATDEVEGLFVKIDGAWCEISTGGGSGSGGHTIVDDSGTDLTQRASMQFKGTYSTDNSTDGVTEVNITREMTKAQFNQLSAAERAGLIKVTDEDSVTATEIPISSSDNTDTKTYIDRGLSGKQNTINEGYDITGLSTPSGITRQNGGYCKIGNLVVVNVRLNLTSNVPAETDIISGFPLPVGSNNMVAVTLNKDTYAVMTTSGAIRVVGNSLTYGVCVASVVYMTATT